MKRFVQVALPIPARRTFTYCYDDEMTTLHRGMRVLVPFGKNMYTGVVVVTDAEPLKDAKYIIEILDQTPAFSPLMLDFTKWIAEYYFASWGETLAAALPQGMAPQTVVTVELIAPVHVDDVVMMRSYAPKRTALLELLNAHKGPLTISYLQQQLKTDSVSAQLEALEEMGYILIRRELNKEVTAKVQKAVTVSHGLLSDTTALKTALDMLDSSAPKQSLLLSSLVFAAQQKAAPMRVAELLKNTKSTQTTLDALVTKGYAEYSMIEVERHNQEHGDTLAKRNEFELELNQEQLHAVETINDGIVSSKPKTFLLHGVTGSGKTLVYMHAIRQCISTGKSALVLLPEISLTPQMIDRYKLAFGDSIAVLHSKMGQGERYDSWRAIKQGKVKIVLGVRSGIFAPLDKLGLLIVDEEHEATYKQESPSPRYNARDAAIIRGIMHSAVVVLGSATPSLESMFNAQTGKYHLLTLRSRNDGAELPLIEVVDMAEQRKLKTVHDGFSTKLLDEIVKRVEKKEGVILLQNRRGFAPRLECDDCGNTPHCYQCNVPLTYHKYSDQLRCHYCGWTITAQKSCNVCGNAEMSEVGSGTQRIEEVLFKLLQERSVNAVIQRVDTDTTQQKGSLRKILKAFTDGSIDIVVGTQMIAKGLDIPRVTLVGVVNADMQLFMNDFRAGERTFQLLTQVAGRAGRGGGNPGEVLIQTKHPRHQAIVSTRLGSYDTFFHDELQQRRDANYPPFTRFVMIELTGKDQEQVHQHAHYYAKFLSHTSTSVLTLGPSKPSVDRVRGLYRRMIIVKGIKSEDPGGNQLRHALLTAASAYHEKHATSAVKVTVDIDSFSMQ